jgi:hypothetical protein
MTFDTINEQRIEASNNDGETVSDIIRYEIWICAPTGDYLTETDMREIADKLKELNDHTLLDGTPCGVEVKE